ncbi:tetratricopeptide repeat protein [Sphingobacterium sp. HJSM2_6]|uniref:tetratricopeptide repeat protein n=1 Tax=Sphingobacterium sp. HJSM2_6 TaxID=3366264 RepID=UPI003BC7CDA2
MKTKEELIQDYIDQVISPEDQLEFDHLLASDEDFKKELAFQLEIRNLLNRRIPSNESALRNTLNELSEAYRSAAPSHVISWKKWLIPVAIAACFILIGRWLFVPDAQVYDLPEMRSEIVRGEVNTELSQYEEAVTAYNKKDYETSAAVLKELVNKFPTTLQYHYYLGLSEVGSDDFKGAVTTLKPLADGTSVFATDAKYYLGIAYFELKSYDEAKAVLQEIPKDHELFAKTQDILSKIEN